MRHDERRQLFLLLGAVLVALALALFVVVASQAEPLASPRSAPLHLRYTPAPTYYYVCATMRTTGYHLCSTGAPLRLEQAHLVQWHWQRTLLFRQVFLVTDVRALRVFLAQGPRCVYQQGGNCV